VNDSRTRGTARRQRVLVVEDDAAILRGLTDSLGYEGYDVLSARTGEEALRLLHEGAPELLILDVMLPGMNGFDICRRARAERRDVGILMLTARALEVDRVMGLDLGADDYMTKPFSLPELLARVRAILRRGGRGDEMPGRIAFDDVVIDFDAYRASRGGQPLHLAPKEFAVLRYLAAHAGAVVPRADLLYEVWGLERLPTTRTVDNHVAQLRAKLEQDPQQPRRMQTVHGVGYRLVLGEELPTAP
jgi:DNA-binding response OmpR family regulator